MRKSIIRASCNIVAYGIGICASIVHILLTRILFEKTQNVAGNTVIASVITVLIYTAILTAAYCAIRIIIRRLFSKKEKNDHNDILADCTAGVIAGTVFLTLVFGENGFQSFAITPTVVACQAVMLVSGIVVNKYYKYFDSYFAICATTIVCIIAEMAGIDPTLIKCVFVGYILAILRNAVSDN